MAKYVDKIIGTAIGSPDGFGADSAATDTDGIRLIDGVTITHSSPIQHIWTFSASTARTSADFTCPCNTPTLSSDAVNFADGNYFCDTTFDLYSRLLWSGACAVLDSQPLLETCCQFNGPPYFTATLPTRTTADVAAHLCVDEDTGEDVRVQIIQLYIQ